MLNSSEYKWKLSRSFVENFSSLFFFSSHTLTLLQTSLFLNKATLSLLSEPATSFLPPHSALHPYTAIMNTGLIDSRFLSKPEELGVVAVGFSGGQVRYSTP